MRKIVVRRTMMVGLLSAMSLAIGSVIGLNAIAWMQARAMTRYITIEGDRTAHRTAQPETLSLFQKASVVLTGVRLPRPINDRTPESVGLAFETHTVELTNQETLEAWFIPSQWIETEQAPSSEGLVLLFPPYGGSKQSLLSAALAFHELGYDTLLVDYRGVGGSSGSDTTLGVREAEDVAHAVAYAMTTFGPGKSLRPRAVNKTIATAAITTTPPTVDSKNGAYPIVLSRPVQYLIK